MDVENMMDGIKKGAVSIALTAAGIAVGAGIAKTGLVVPEPLKNNFAANGLGIQFAAAAGQMFYLYKVVSDEKRDLVNKASFTASVCAGAAAIYGVASYNSQSTANAQPQTAITQKYSSAEANDAAKIERKGEAVTVTVPPSIRKIDGITFAPRQ